MTKRILVVDDEAMIRLFLVEILRDEGFSVDEAATGDGALALVEGGPPFDLLITDIQLHGNSDGVALARQARLRLPQIAVIYTTGQQRPEMTGSLDAFVSKPYGPEDMLTTVHRLLGGTTSG